VTVLRSGSATDVGRVRKVNQDLPLEANNLYAVADGMGGHVGGEVAARVAIEALASAFAQEPTTTGLLDAVSKANRAVWQESQENGELRGMGTTLTAMALVSGSDGQDVLALANVGDSRAYVFSGGHVVQVTADHSRAEERMRHGEMTEEEAAVHPQRHILTRALGVSSVVDTDMWELRLRSGDRVLICSDGLSNELGLDQLSAILGAEGDPGEAARQLVQMANEHGGADNITVVIVDVLVGDDGIAAASVVTPIGILAAQSHERAAADGLAAGMMAASSSDTTSVPRVDTLAPGARLGFAVPGSDLGTDAQQSGEFFRGATGSMPVARSTARVPPTRPRVAPAPEKESRRARRRRLGIPRRVTLRVILFVLLVLTVPTGAYFAIRWYAYDNWFLAIKGDQIVIKQGHTGGVMWFDPKVVDRTGVTTSKVLPTGLTQIRSGVQEPTLADAKHYVANLHQEWVFLHSATKPAPGSGANSVGPSGSIPNITAPPPTCATTTTLPGTSSTTAPAVTTTTALCTPPTTSTTSP